MQMQRRLVGGQGGENQKVGRWKYKQFLCLNLNIFTIRWCQFVLLFIQVEWKKNTSSWVCFECILLRLFVHCCCVSSTKWAIWAWATSNYSFCLHSYMQWWNWVDMNKFRISDAVWIWFTATKRRRSSAHFMPIYNGHDK